MMQHGKPCICIVKWDEIDTCEVFGQGVDIVWFVYWSCLFLLDNTSGSSFTATDTLKQQKYTLRAKQQQQ
jgi:hypothetical protein